MDPRGQGLRRHATHMLQFRPGADVSMLNAIMHVIVEEELYDQQYIDAYTENWEAQKAHLAGFAELPEKFAVKCICDLDEGRGKALAGMRRGIGFTTDLAAVLADPDIDIVDICLPPHLHFRACMEALDAGKIGASDVLLFRREFVEGQRQYVEALFEAQSARIALDLATGRTPIQFTPAQETQP